MGKAYIADFNGNRLISYANRSSFGVVIFDGPGLTPDRVKYPVGLHFDTFTNSLLIANFQAHNVIRYTPGSTNWTSVAGETNGQTSIVTKK